MEAPQRTPGARLGQRVHDRAAGLVRHGGRRRAPAEVRAGRPARPHGAAGRLRQVAQTLVDALGCKEADHKTLELIDVAGTAQTDAELASMFAALQPDTGLDGVLDRDNFPECTQPKRVREQIARIETMRAEQ